MSRQVIDKVQIVSLFACCTIIFISTNAMRRRVSEGVYLPSKSSVCNNTVSLQDYHVFHCIEYVYLTILISHSTSNDALAHMSGLPMFLLVKAAGMARTTA